VNKFWTNFTLSVYITHAWHNLYTYKNLLRGHLPEFSALVYFWQASHYVKDGIQVTSFRQCCTSKKVEYWSSGSIVCVFFPTHDYLYIKVLYIFSGCITTINYYFARGSGCKVLCWVWLSVCLSVCDCPRGYLWNHACDLCQIFCVCCLCLGLGPPPSCLW